VAQLFVDEAEGGIEIVRGIPGEHHLVCEENLPVEQYAQPDQETGGLPWKRLFRAGHREVFFWQAKE
jgi:hypothetical protein